MSRENLYNQQVEVQVLSSVFIDNNALTEIIDFLEAEDFYLSPHKLIYDAMTKLYSSNTPITPLTLFENLKAVINQVGGITYLSEIAASGVTSQGIRSYAQIIKEKSYNRRILKDLKASIRDIEKENKSYSKVVDNLQNSFNEIASVGRKVESMESIMTRYIELLEKRTSGEIENLVFETGLKGLDNFIGGLERQNLVILAARPSMGKSLVGLSMALDMALKSKLKVGFFHLEMGDIPSVERIVSNRALIPMNRLKTGKLNDEEWSRLVGCCDEVCKGSFNMFNDLYTLKAIIAECKRLKYQKGLDVVFIDYLQLIETEKKQDSRVADVSYISRSLKLLAKELDIVVVALSQLSRGPEARINHRPLLADLRDSGSIEQDADIVMFLYRDDYYNGESEDKGFIEFIIGKHRNGAVGTVKMLWSGEYQSVGDIRN